MTRLNPLVFAIAALLMSSAVHSQSTPAYQYRVPISQMLASPGSAQLSLSPSNLSFSDLVVGSNAASAFVLQNSGAQPLSLSGIHASNTTSFVLDSSACPAMLAPGDMCAVGLSFAPISRGTHSGSLQINYEGGSAQASYAGRGLQGELQASTGALSFNSVILPSSDAQAFQLSNTGDATVSPISIEANAPFAVDGNCSTIMPGQSCSLSIRFEPSVPGSANGSLQVTSPVGSLTISLAGAAVAGESVAAVTGGNPISFGTVIQNAASVDRVVTLRNDGNVSMSVSGVSGLPLGVSVQANNCTDVAPGQSCALTLRLATASPTAFAGATATTLGATSNANLSLTGQVEAAQSIVQVVSGNPVAFGSVQQNSTAVDRVVSLRNTGNSPLSISGFSGLPAGVTVQPHDCSNVVPNGTCSVAFRLATTSVTSFSNVSVGSQGATTNASISMSGAVAAAGYPASAFSFRAIMHEEYDEDYSVNYPIGRSVYARNGSGAALTINTVNFCPDAMDRTSLYVDSGTATAWTHNGSAMHAFCTVKTLNLAWANGAEFGLHEGAGYGDYGSFPYPVFRPTGNGYIAIKLSNGQTIEVRSSGVTMK